RFRRSAPAVGAWSVGALCVDEVVCEVRNNWRLIPGGRAELLFSGVNGRNERFCGALSFLIVDHPATIRQQYLPMNRTRPLLPVVLFFFAALVALGAPYRAAAQTGPDVPEMASLDEKVEGFMDKWNVPGGAVAVSYQGRLVYARG